MFIMFYYVDYVDEDVVGTNDDDDYYGYDEFKHTVSYEMYVYDRTNGEIRVREDSEI